MLKLINKKIFTILLFKFLFISTYLTTETYLILAAIVLSAEWLNNESKSVRAWLSFSESKYPRHCSFQRVWMGKAVYNSRIFQGFLNDSHTLFKEYELWKILIY